mmetsp:Transcript_90869/g.164095  ORF Transcript_90869/g.164095 Transcript_90869/m.164095 type:complete len:226 (+) Transcript_90869:129-806(+)
MRGLLRMTMVSMLVGRVFPVELVQESNLELVLRGPAIIPDAVEEGVALCLQLLLHCPQQCPLRLAFFSPDLEILLMLLFLLFSLSFLFNGHVIFDGEGLGDLKDDGHTNDVEAGEDVPGHIAPCSRSSAALQGLGHLGHELAQELGEPGAQGHGHVVEVEDEPVLLGVVGPLQLRPALIQDAPEEVHAQDREEEEHDPQQLKNVTCAAYHPRYDLHHELHPWELP